MSAKLFRWFKSKKPDAVAATYKCACCGTVYDSLPLCFGSAFPDYYFSVPPEERSVRIALEESLCIIDNEHFFHRGRLTIPITDYTEPLVFNVWTSISQDNFALRTDLWNNPGRVLQEPYFGWLQTSVPGYGDTLNIRTIAREQPIPDIPEMVVIEEHHPLTIDQEQGITYQKAMQIVDEILKIEHRKQV